MSSNCYCEEHRSSKKKTFSSEQLQELGESLGVSHKEVKRRLKTL